MDSFFDTRRIWPGGGPFPHFLVLFDRHPAYRAYARAHAGLLSRYGHLGAVPEEWLHCTVQGIHHAVTAEQMQHLRERAREAFRTMRPISVQMGPVWPGVTAITVAVYPEEGMAELNRRARAAASAVPGICLRPREERFWPHGTLAYARQDTGRDDDRLLNRALRQLRPQRVDLRIDRVHLVSQRQHPDRGFYTWEIVEEYPLEGIR